MVKAAGIGKLKVMACDKKQNELQSLTISDLHVIPGSRRLMEKGFKMVGEGDRITFEKGTYKLVCDMTIKTTQGMLISVDLKRMAMIDTEVTTPVVTMAIQQAHCKLVHRDEDTTRKIANQLVWVITRGSLKPYEACAEAKTKQKNVMKRNEHDVPSTATEVHGRVYLDLNSIRAMKNCK
jgi:hypothetical protein